MRFQFLITLTLCLSLSLIAGDKLGFSGDWEFSKDKSTLDEMGIQFLQSKMTLIQTENELVLGKIFQGPEGEFKDEEKLTLDGKECKSEIWGGSTRVTTANWNEKGDTLTLLISITMNRDGQESVIDMDEKWSLSKDGKELSIKHSSESEWGERNITMVFTKIDKK